MSLMRTLPVSSAAARFQAFAFIVLASCTSEGAPREARSDTAAVDTVVVTRSEPVPAPVGDGAAPKLLPIDEADSSFVTFRQRALAALQQKDTAFLFAMVAPDIRYSFGNGGGLSGFKRSWKLERPAQSRIWAVLTRLLELGGKYQGERFVAPYVYAAWPQNIDAFQHVAVTGTNVPAYGRPNTDMPAVASLSHSILRLDRWQGLGADGLPEPDAFARIILPDQRSAWVRAQDVYSPVGYRAFFERRNGRWVMSLLVAGD